MLLIDANIAMYAAGAAHPFKAPSVALLQRIASGEQPAILDAETLQEVLHRYRSIGRHADGKRVYDLLRNLFAEIAPITAEVMDCTAEILEKMPHAGARDAVHAAVALLHGAQICSYDKDFDAFAGIVRVEPAPATGM